MTKSIADIRHSQIHNIKAMLGAIRDRNTKDSIPSDPVALKLHKDLLETIRMCSVMEQDLLEVSSQAEINKKAQLA